MTEINDRVRRHIEAANTKTRAEREAAKRKRQEWEERNAALRPEVRRMGKEVVDTMRRYGIPSSPLYKEVETDKNEKGWNHAYKLVGRARHLFAAVEDGYVAANYAINGDGAVLQCHRVSYDVSKGWDNYRNKTTTGDYLAIGDFTLYNYLRSTDAYDVLRDDRVVEVIAQQAIKYRN